MLAKRRVSLAAIAILVSLSLASCGDDKDKKEADSTPKEPQNTSFTITPNPLPTPQPTSFASSEEYAKTVLGAAYSVVQERNNGVQGTVNDDALLTEVTVVKQPTTCPASSGNKEFTLRPESPIAIGCPSKKKFYISEELLKKQPTEMRTELIHGAAFQVFNQPPVIENRTPTTQTACAAGVMARPILRNNSERTSFVQFYNNMGTPQLELATRVGLKTGSLERCRVQFQRQG